MNCLKQIAFPLCTARLTRCFKKVEDLGSPVAAQVDHEVQGFKAPSSLDLHRNGREDISLGKSRLLYLP